MTKKQEINKEHGKKVDTDITNKKFWEELMAIFPFITNSVFNTTRITCKTPRSRALLLLRVYSMAREYVYRAVA
jgi:hypothetical protein